MRAFASRRGSSCRLPFFWSARNSELWAQGADLLGPSSRLLRWPWSQSPRSLCAPEKGDTRNVPQALPMHCACCLGSPGPVADCGLGRAPRVRLSAFQKVPLNVFPLSRFVRCESLERMQLCMRLQKQQDRFSALRHAGSPEHW